MTPEQDARRQEARRLHQQGMTLAAIGRQIGVSGPTVKKYCKDLGLPNNQDSRRGRAEGVQNPANNRLLQLPERARAFDMLLAGKSPGEVAVVLKRDPRTVRRWVDEEIEARIGPQVERLRILASARLDGLRQIAWEIAHETTNSSKLRLEAIGMVLHVERRYAALNGLDSPVRVEAILTEKSQADVELEELLREAAMRNDAVQGVIVGEVVDDPSPA